MFRSSTLLHWRGTNLPSRQPVSLLRSLSTKAQGNPRLPLTLYRQLINWCNHTDERIPLSHFIPPVSLSPPEIEASRLKELLSSEELRAQFPPKSIFKERSIISPIHNASMAKLFFRAVFRLNKDTPGGSAEHQKIRVSLAFDALRSLNELTGAIETLEKKRALHIDRNGVTFGVGQVVKHKVEQWRGVITGWHHHDKVSEANNEPTRPTSLTMKMYSLDPVDSVKYKVLLDSGDVHMHYYPRRHELANASNIHQSDLELVEDERYELIVWLKTVVT